MIISVIGLMFGDEGKGHTVAALTKKYNATANIRFSGGSQAAHRVVNNGISHIFAQIGSGSAVSSTVKTYLSEQMAMDPLNLLNEIYTHHKNGIENLFNRLFINSYTPIITEYHKLINKARELNRLENRISTTGLGVGEVHSDVKNNKTILYASDIFKEELLYEKLYLIEKEKKEEVDTFSNIKNQIWPDIGIVSANLFEAGSILKNCIRNDFSELLFSEFAENNVILEGSQGTLLDKDFGFHPFITRANVSLLEAYKLLDIYSVPKNKRINLGITRAYTVRHGLGYFPSEDQNLTQLLPDSHNKFNEWQREFRCGWLDIDLLKYSLQCNKFITGIVITNLDRLENFYIFEKGEKVYTSNLLEFMKVNFNVVGSSFSENIEKFMDLTI